MPPIHLTTMQTRALASAVEGIPHVTPSDGRVLQSLALSLSTLSVVSSVLSFYWFLKMRRTFRHDLIMLLIQSDMFKSIWLMAYPLLTFSMGPVASNSTFCQAQGFLLAVGIEAADFAVLTIALHTALCVFNCENKAGEGGLYPYRKIAYVCWFFLPIMMASLAFTNDDLAYVSTGTYCYLPVRPFWYRLALAWIPRYIIFAVILGIYISIYYYVQRKFNGFNTKPKVNNKDGTPKMTRHDLRSKSVPRLPALALHGLLAESDASSATSRDSKKFSRSSTFSALLRAPFRRLTWPSLRSTKSGLAQGRPRSESLPEADSFAGPGTPMPLPIYVGGSSANYPASERGDDDSSENPAESRTTSWQDTFVRRVSARDASLSGMKRNSSLGLISMLRNHPEDTPSTPLSRLSLSFPSDQVRSRDIISRQLRLMFIYPVAYIALWILPFAYHVTQYDGHLALYPPFPLGCLSVTSICLQGTINCWLFSSREKPWEHLVGSDNSFCSSLKFWTGWRVNRRTSITGPGRTRAEMFRDSEAAHRRRTEEDLALRTDSTLSKLDRKTERSWFDHQRYGQHDGSRDRQTELPSVEEENSLVEESLEDPSPFDDGNALPPTPRTLPSPRRPSCSSE